MARILANDAISEKSLATLRDMGMEVTQEHYPIDQLKEQIKEFDALIVRSATKVRRELIDEAVKTGRLKLIVRAGVGLDNIDADYAQEKGIAVQNTPDSSKVSVAELAIGHMFALARSLHHSNLTMRQGKWLKKEYKGVELEGKTLGLIGFGRIAQVTATKAAALGMKVVYYDKLGEIEGFQQFPAVTKDQLLAEADFISLHIPYDKKEGPVLAEREFAMMKDGVFIVNCARGGVVCEDSLLKALDSGKVTAAALDVFEEEPVTNQAVYSHEKLSLSPHIGASTNEAQERIGEEIVKIIEEFFGR